MSRTLRKLRLFILSFVSGLLLFTTASHGFSADDLEVLKLSARDQAAIIRTDDGTVHLVRVGDAIGKDGRVIEIDSQRLIIKSHDDRETVTFIVRLEDGGQTISTMKDIGDKRPAFYQTLQNGKEIRR